VTEEQIINIFGSGKVEEALKLAFDSGFSTLFENFKRAVKHIKDPTSYYEHYKQNNGRIPGAQIEMGGGQDTRQQTAMKHIKALNASSLLDIGCADGSFCFFCLKEGIVKSVIGIDPWEEGIAWATEYALRINIDALFIPGLFEDIKVGEYNFDVIHLGEILEHVIDPVVILRSLRRYHPKGIVITIPMERPPVTSDEKVLLTDGRVAEHVRLITPTLLHEYCQASGFEIIRSDILGQGWVNLIATIV
jgi:ubiquinone/menaquinone biosynthesis C-methylase UbiE